MFVVILCGKMENINKLAEQNKLIIARSMGKNNNAFEKFAS